MSLEVKGMIEIIDYLDRTMQQVKQNKPLKDASKYVLTVEVEVATRMHSSERSEHIGVEYLKRFPVKILRNGNRIVSIGIRGRQTKSSMKQDQINIQNGDSRPTYWDKIKGLWFQNYGYVEWKTGRYYSGSHWIDIAYEESAEEAYRIICEGMSEIWKNW